MLNRTVGAAAGVLIGGVARAAWAARRNDERQDRDRSAKAPPFGTGLIRPFDFA